MNLVPSCHLPYFKLRLSHLKDNFDKKDSLLSYTISKRKDSITKEKINYFFNG